MGLVLALAVGDSVGGIDLVLIGWILAGVGVLALVIDLVTNAQRSRHTVEKSVHKDVTTDWDE